MNKKIDEKSADGWSRRAAAEDLPSVRPSDVPNSVARVLSGDVRDGWNPWEIWLRRIDQPRRRRAERE
jgi:hypothetical protein